MGAALCAVYKDLESIGVEVADIRLKANTAIAFSDNFIAIDRSRCKTDKRERTVLAHEAGHYLSGAFYLAYSPYEIKEQAEHKAFVASVERYLPADAIRRCFRQGITEPWQFAEYFDLEEDFIKNALHYWTECRGMDFNKMADGNNAGE